MYLLVNEAYLSKVPAPSTVPELSSNLLQLLPVYHSFPGFLALSMESVNLFMLVNLEKTDELPGSL